MYNVSSKYREVVLQTAREWDLYLEITLQDGTCLRVAREDVNLGTAILKEGATCSDTLQTGSTFSNSFEFTLLNADGRYTAYDFYRAKIKPYVGLSLTDEQDFEYVPLGEFNVIEPVKKFSTIPIVSFDNMSLLNQPFDFSKLTFPLYAPTLLQEIEVQTGIRISAEFKAKVEQLPYQINSLLTNGPTCRDILAGMGIMLLENLRFDREGVLESFWYTPTGGYTDKTTRVGNSSYGDNQLSVTGVSLLDAYGNTFSVGTPDYAVALPQSPIIQGSEMSLPLLEITLEKLRSISHRPASITWIGDPALQVGDIINHIDAAAGTVSLPVMRRTYKFAGTETLESLGLDSSTQQQQSSTDKQLKANFESAERNRVELETKIEQTENSVLIKASERFVSRTDYSALQVEVNNITAEVAHQEETLQGLKSEITSVQQTAGSLDVAIRQVVENGAEKVVTKESKYTLDDEGLKISKSGEEMANKLDITGMYVTRSGEVMLQANNEGVVATDVKVRNYLIVGSHARFEDYNNGMDSKRTACFFIT